MINFPFKNLGISLGFSKLFDISPLTQYRWQNNIWKVTVYVKLSKME